MSKTKRFFPREEKKDKNVYLKRKKSEKAMSKKGEIRTMEDE